MAIVQGILLILFTLCVLYMVRQVRLREANNAALAAEKQTAEAETAALKTELEAARSQIEQDLCARRDLFFAWSLAGGHYQTPEEVCKAGAEVGIPLTGPCFAVLLARRETWGELYEKGELDRKDVNFILRNSLENAFSCKTYGAEIKDYMAAIMDLPENPGDSLETFVEEARRALEVLETEFGMTVTVAFSRVYDSPMALPRAMQDTEHIFEYWHIMDEDCPITTYEQLTHRHIHQSATSFLDFETRLVGCVRAADFSGMRLVLHELITNEFGDTRPTVDTFRFRVYGVVNTLLYLINDIRGVVGDQVVNDLDPGPRLTEAQSLDEIVAVMDDLLESLEQYTHEKRQPTTSAWVEKVHGFVEERHRDPDLTVSYTADQFHVTPTYCSKVFRERYGMRLFDFIQLTRLETAKELMKTELSLKDIAEQSGFSSALTMSRAFKRYEGAAPSKIREGQTVRAAKELSQ